MYNVQIGIALPRTNNSLIRGCPSFEDSCHHEASLIAVDSRMQHSVKFMLKKVQVIADYHVEQAS
jgi:hypothetical protein